MEDIIDAQLIETMRKLSSCRKALAQERELTTSLIELLRMASARLMEVNSMINTRLCALDAPPMLALRSGDNDAGD